MPLEVIHGVESGSITILIQTIIAVGPVLTPLWSLEIAELSHPYRPCLIIV
jgi:hypothetical protein